MLVLFLKNLNLKGIGKLMSEPQFIMHEKDDSCAVAVVEDLKEKTKCSCWIMSNDETLEITINSDIPIGHKVAMKDISKGDTIIKYGVDIGKCVKGMKKGDHLHVHNVKTKRW